MAAPAAEPGGGAGALAGEWFRAYTEYLKRAADQSADTIGLYHRVTDHIVSGELAPTAAQEMLTAFVQSRATSYSEELSQLNMRFFSEMVRISTAYAHELGQAILPEAPAPPAPPPFDASDPAEWFQQLGDYSQRLSASIGAAYQSLVERAAEGEVPPSRVQDAAAGYLQRRLPEYLGELGKLYFELLNGLTELRVRSEQEFLDSVLDRIDGGAAAFELTLAGPLGGTATASLSIGNTRDEPVRIRCVVSEVRRADGVGPAFAADATVMPDGLELPPGAEGRLVVTVQLDEGSYEADVLYVGTLQVTGHGEPRLEVPLRITATGQVATAEP